MFLGQFGINSIAQFSFQKHDEIMFMKTNEAYLSQIALKTCNSQLITLRTTLLS